MIDFQGKPESRSLCYFSLLEKWSKCKQKETCTHLISVSVPFDLGMVIFTKQSCVRAIVLRWRSLEAKWAGYISRIYPESTQGLDPILGPFWFVYTAESPQDLKKSVNKSELTQKVPRKSIKFWALSGLFTLF